MSSLSGSHTGTLVAERSTRLRPRRSLVGDAVGLAGSFEGLATGSDPPSTCGSRFSLDLDGDRGRLKMADWGRGCLIGTVCWRFKLGRKNGSLRCSVGEGRGSPSPSESSSAAAEPDPDVATESRSLLVAAKILGRPLLLAEE